MNRRPAAADRARTIAVYTAFATNGFIFASWVSRLPAVRTRLSASEPELGIALLAIAVGAVVAMPLTSRMCDRFGHRRVLTASIIGCAVSFFVATTVADIAALPAVLLAVGLTYGTWDVAMNAAAHDIERTTGRPLMPRFHGVFSVGGLIGAGLGALAAAAGMPVWAHLAVAATVVIAVGGAATRLLPAHLGFAPPPEAPARRVVSVRLVVLGLLTAAATLGEGAAADWSAIFLHDERDASEALAALGYAGFAAAMAAGRFAGTWLLGRCGRVIAMRGSGLLAAASVLVLVAVDSIGTGLVAMVGWGLGVALVFPATMSAGAENAERPAHGIATVATVGYGGFLLGPPLIGFLGGRAGLSTALLLVSLLGIAIVALAPAAREIRPPAQRDGVTAPTVSAHRARA